MLHLIFWMTVCITMCEMSMSPFRRIHNRSLFLSSNQEHGKVRILDCLRYLISMDKNLRLKVYLYFIDFLEDILNHRRLSIKFIC